VLANAANLPAYRSQIANTMTAGPAPSEAALRVLTERPGVVDYCADDMALEGYADGDTVADWVARRGGLTASVTGSPTYTAPDSDLGVPSVAYGATGDVHETPATIDWSAYSQATILGVHYTESVSGILRGMNLSAGDDEISDATGRGIGTYRVNGRVTALHYTDEPEASTWRFERDNVVDPPLAVTVAIHDLTSESLDDRIRLYVGGVENTGAASGDLTQGAAWQSDLRVRLGGRDVTASGSGLDGRLHRFVAMPSALSEAQALRASRCLLYTART
jgi:hypothetical protein